MTLKPILLLIQTWLAHPVRAPIGVLGIGLVVWSILPLFSHSTAHTPLRFAGEIVRSWQQRWILAMVGMLGVLLFSWSVWPVVTMQ